MLLPCSPPSPPTGHHRHHHLHHHSNPLCSCPALDNSHSRIKAVQTLRNGLASPGPVVLAARLARTSTPWLDMRACANLYIQAVIAGDHFRVWGIELSRACVLVPAFMTSCNASRNLLSFPCACGLVECPCQEVRCSSYTFCSG